MWILKTALAALLAVPGTTVKGPPPAARPVIAGSSTAELARSIKADLESISGAGTVTMSVHGDTRFGARISIPGFNPKICTQIYDREMELQQLFPDLDFEFSFDGPELARAIKADIENISGRNTVDVSIDSKTLFNVRIAIPGFNYDIYNQVFDRELEFYRVFRDLNFDFYVRPITPPTP